MLTKGNHKISPDSPDHGAGEASLGAATSEMDIEHDRPVNHIEKPQSAPQNTITPGPHMAIENGDFEWTKLFLEKSPNRVNDSDDRGWCALHVAAQKGDVRIFQLLIEKGANPSCITNAKLTILHIACVNAKYDMCQYILLNFPFLLNSVDDRLWNAAHFAAQGGDIRILQLLAEKGLSINKIAKNKVSILHIECSQANYEMPQYILSKHPDMIDSLNEFGWRPVHYAVKGGNVHVLQLLKNKGVSLNVTTKKKETLLQIACLCGRYEICQYLLSICPDNLKDVDEQGWNAAHYAAQGGDIRILQLLSDHMLSLKETTQEKCTILHISCRNAKYDMCRHILNVCPKILHDVNEFGWNAAHYASQGGDVRILQLLAEKGISVKATTEDKCTILHISCSNGNYEMSKYILSRYPEMIDSVNDFGWRTAHYAARGGNMKILQLLIDKGTSLGVTTGSNETLLHIACLYGRYEICQYLLSVYPDNLQNVDERGWNATHFAAKGGDVRILQILADNTLSLREKTHEGCTILHISCSNAKYDMCKHILQVLPEILHDVNEQGWNAAHYVADDGNTQILDLLFERGLKI